VNGLSPLYEDCMLEVKGGKHVELPCVPSSPRLLDIRHVLHCW